MEVVPPSDVSAGMPPCPPTFSVDLCEQATGSQRLLKSLQGDPLTFAALRSRREVGDLSEVLVEGQVVQKRCHGRHVCFFDLQETSCFDVDLFSSELTEEQLVELVVDEVLYGVTDSSSSSSGVIRNIFRTSHPGDVLRARGRLRSTATSGGAVVVETVAMRVVRRWTEAVGVDAKFPMRLVRRSTAPLRGGDLAAVKLKGLEGDQQLCKFFVTQGQCKRPGCLFGHARGVKTAWVDAVKKRRAAASQHPDDPHLALDKSSHRSRAQVFCRWLVETYGLERLRSGKGVLDVAGGRGEIAFELTLEHNVPVTVVDPRPRKLSRQQYKRLRADVGVDGEEARRWLDAKVVSYQTYFDESFLEDPERGQVAAEASVVVGLHPDEATGAICELALRLGRPFAVVPCCVFADDFPGRVLKSDISEDGGLQVRTHEDLCTWIQRLAPGIQAGFLNFTGKNRVVYSLSK